MRSPAFTASRETGGNGGAGIDDVAMSSRAPPTACRREKVPETYNRTVALNALSKLFPGRIPLC